MSVRVVGSTIHVEGAGLVEDAEPVLAALSADPAAMVDLSRATRLHSAIVQLLVGLRPRIVGAPSDAFQARHIVPLLDLEK
jgi:hypothetical protein